MFDLRRLFHLFGTSEPAYAVGLQGGWGGSPAATGSHDDEQHRLRAHRAYRRVQAAVLCRPAGLRLFDAHEDHVAGDVAKIRIFSDERLQSGERLKLEIIVCGKVSEKFVAKVAWLDTQAPGSAARYDIGLHIEHIDDDTADLLRTVLAR